MEIEGALAPTQRQSQPRGCFSELMADVKEHRVFIQMAHVHQAIQWDQRRDEVSFKGFGRSGQLGALATSHRTYHSDGAHPRID
jgi:hypothetical protein